MLPYWLFFSLFVLNAIIHIRPSLVSTNGRYLIRPSLLSIKGRYWSIEWVSIFILLVFIVGLRHQVGADWSLYSANLEDFRLGVNTAGGVSDDVIKSSRDPGYHFLNWLAVKFDQKVVLVNFIAAIFFSYGLIIFCRNQALPSLSMLVAFPYIVTVVGMGYTRQSVAIAFFMLGIVQLEKGNFWRYIQLIIFASLFHTSAFLLFPLSIVVVKRYLFIKILALVIFMAAVYYFMLDYIVYYVKVTYFDSSFSVSSPGTIIRFVMVLFPALLLLLNINRLNINRISNSIDAIRLWKVIALSSFLMIIPLIMLPSNTIVDRILLYWLPLQLFVFGNIPVAYLRNKYIYIIIYFMVIVYSFSVFAVWLSFSNNSFAWAPYSNYLWL